MNLAILGAPGLGAPELILIVFVLVLLFGAKKLPEMARGSGRALRIFKAETKGLMNEDDAPDAAPPAQGAIAPPVVSTGSSAAPQSPRVEPVVPVPPVDETAPRDSDR